MNVEKRLVTRAQEAAKLWRRMEEAEERQRELFGKQRTASSRTYVKDARRAIRRTERERGRLNRRWRKVRDVNVEFARHVQRAVERLLHRDVFLVAEKELWVLVAERWSAPRVARAMLWPLGRLLKSVLFRGERWVGRDLTVDVEGFSRTPLGSLCFPFRAADLERTAASAPSAHEKFYHVAVAPPSKQAAPQLLFENALAAVLAQALVARRSPAELKMTALSLLSAPLFPDVPTAVHRGGGLVLRNLDKIIEKDPSLAPSRFHLRLALGP